MAEAGVLFLFNPVVFSMVNDSLLSKHRRTFENFGAPSIKVLEPLIPSIDISELDKVRPSPYFEAVRL